MINRCTCENKWKTKYHLGIPSAEIDWIFFQSPIQKPQPALHVVHVQHDDDSCGSMIDNPPLLTADVSP